MDILARDRSAMLLEPGESRGLPAAERGNQSFGGESESTSSGLRPVGSPAPAVSAVPASGSGFDGPTSPCLRLVLMPQVVRRFTLISRCAITR